MVTGKMAVSPKVRTFVLKLVFSILASLLLFTFSASSESPHSHDFTTTAMRIAGIVMLFLGFGFYVYAYRRLPASTQEMIFTQQAIQEISKTRSAIERRKRSLV